MPNEKWYNDESNRSNSSRFSWYFKSKFQLLRFSRCCRVNKLGLSETVRSEIVESLENGIFPNLGLNDETLEMIQDQFKKFTDEEIVPHANEWHLKDDLIPDDVLTKMSELGVFSIAIPENYGGLGMGKGCDVCCYRRTF